MLSTHHDCRSYGGRYDAGPHRCRAEHLPASCDEAWRPIVIFRLQSVQSGAAHKAQDPLIFCWSERRVEITICPPRLPPPALLRVSVPNADLLTSRSLLPKTGKPPPARFSRRPSATRQVFEKNVVHIFLLRSSFLLLQFPYERNVLPGD